MPYATAPDGASIFYRRRGAVGAPPVLLIAGLGLTLASWRQTVAWLEERHDVILLDTRGSGRSSSRGRLFTTGRLAADAVAVLDACGVRAADVYGYCFGGLVAERLASLHPARVRRVVLGAALAGGRDLALPRLRTLAATVRALMHRDPRARLRALARLAGPAGSLREIRSALVHVRLGSAGLRRQVAAAALHLCRRSRQLAMPVLVLHGADDPLVPPRNAVRLARRTGGALRLIDGAGHAYHADAPDETRTAVLAFLERADAAG